MVVVIDVEPIRERFLTVAPFLDERGRRLVAAAEAFAVGYGGIAAVAMATGMAPSTIGRGLRELAQDEPSERDAQFSRINTQVAAALAEKQPVISVDTKKKELVGDFRNNGREYRPQGNPEAVRVHDFLIKELGRAVPYGVYDLAANSGWVSVGVDHDTAAFAVNSIRQWWQTVGRTRYPDATRLLITATPAPAKAGGGGSNGSRVRLWKRELQKLANEHGLDIMVCHLPPGTSKWDKIEHRLFSFISQNWRAKPLVSYRVIVELISATTTETGLTVRCQLDTGQYPSGIVVSDAELAAINIQRAEFHGEWNYTISPNHPPNHA